MKIKLNGINCELCKKEFTPKTVTQQFCSRHCQSSNKKTQPAFYSVECDCKCGCGGFVMNPDTHYRYRRFIPQHVNSGGTHPRLGYKESEEHVCMRIKKAMSKSGTKTPTCLETELYAYLDSRAISYERQYRVGRFIPDAYIEELKLCIFADGGYWHSLPDVAARDKRANDYLYDLGYSVVRLPAIGKGYTLDLSKLINLLNNKIAIVRL